MQIAFPTRLSRWWHWLIGQNPPNSQPSRAPTPEAAPMGELIAFPTPEKAQLTGTEESIRASQAELTQSLLETIQQPTLSISSAAISVLTSAERARTLESLKNLQQIPSLQSLARSFSEATNRDNASVAEVVEAVQKDPALCVRILRLANSVAISPNQRIDDIMSAVQMLGVLRVRQAAQVLFTLRDAKSVASGFDWRHLWIHSLATASVAEELEKQLDLPANPHLYLAALLHDVGKIVLSTISPEAYRSVLMDAWNGSERLGQLEEARLGVSHGEAGVIFAEHCELHPEIIATIAFHATPAKANEHALPVALVHVANYVSKSYGLGFSGARLNESDGDFETLAAWQIIEQHRGIGVDFETLNANLQKFVIQLKPELKSLREGI